MGLIFFLKCDRKSRENESALYLEMRRFSDPTLYLQNNQYEISDRLIYNKPIFEVKNFQLLPMGPAGGAATANPPLWKTDHDPNFAVHFF